MKRKGFSLIKLIAVLLAITLVSILAAGCGKKTNTSSSADSLTSGDETSSELSSDLSSGGTTVSGAATASNTGTSKSSGTTTTKFVKPTYNLNGKTVVIWTPPAMGAPRNNTIEYSAWKDIEKRYNCKLQFTKVDYQTAVTKNTAAALAGTAECDIWMPEWYNVYPSFIIKNMVAPLSDYYPFDKDPNWSDPDLMANLWWGGKAYGLFAGAPSPIGGLWYNKTLLKRANLEDPATLVAKNQWTWDKFLEMCKKLTIDTNGDGKTDQWGYYDVYLFENAIITNGGKYVDISNPKNPVFNINTEQNKRAVKWALDLVSTYKVVPEVGTVYNMELFDLFYNYKAAFFTYTPAFGPLCVKKGMKPEELGITYFPKGPDAKDYAIHAPTLALMYAIMPQTKLDKNALTCLLADYLCIWDKSKDYAIGRDELAEYGYTKDTTTGMDKIYAANKDFLLNGHKKNVPSYNYNFLLGDVVTTELWKPLAEGKIDIQSGITSIIPVAQSKINQMMVQAPQ